MVDSADDRLELVSVTADRLRLAQMDFAGESAEQRRAYLEQELRGALEVLDRGDRKKFLAELRGRFPKWDGSSRPAAKAEPMMRVEPLPPVVPSLNPDPLPETKPLEAPELVSLLGNLASSLTAEQKRALAEPLVAAGLIPAAPEVAGAWPAGMSTAFEELARQLDLDSAHGEAPDPLRVVDLARRLVEFTCKVSRLAWQTWHEIAPPGSIRRTAPRLQGILARYSTGAAEATSENTEAELERLRQLIAALISGIGQLGQQFASAHLTKFSPSEILSAVVAENPPIYKNRDALCWKKYQELADMLDPNSINDEIRRLIAESVERLMRGLRQPDRSTEPPPTRGLTERGPVL